MLRKGLQLLGGSTLAKRIVTGTPITRGLSRRFVPGETLESVVEAAGEANRQGLKVTMNYLGEAVRSPETARAAANAYVDLLTRIDELALDANISVKFTQLGQDIGEEPLRENLDRLLEVARRRSIFVRFDMESSDYTERTLQLFEQLWSEGHRNIGVVLQAALRRTAGDVRRMIDLGARVRLCKGAYDEPASVAFQSVREIRRSFIELMRLLLGHGNYPAIATHDERLIRAARAEAERRALAADSFEFQLLYGVRRDLQGELGSAGFPVRVYIPFGEMWYPYLMRRLAERPQNFFFLVGSVVKESPLGALWRLGDSKPADGDGKGG